MKRISLIIATTFVSVTLLAQNDSTRTQHADTIKIGGMVIIKKDSPDQHRRQTTVNIGNQRNQKHYNVSTAQFIVDLGFANWEDRKSTRLNSSHW